MKKPTIVITGCSRGIGKEVLELLKSKRAYTIVGISRNWDGDDSRYADISIHTCDLSNPEATVKTAREILAATGGVDILVNNAGTSVFKPVEEIELSDWHRVLNVNLTAPFILTSVFIEGMKARNFGRIINISSDAEKISFSGASAYCASKAGLKLFSDCVRKETDGHNIHITTIAPGRVDTYFNHKTPGQRPLSLNANDVAQQVMYVIEQPEKVEIEAIYLNSSLEKSLH
jgi:short-subunit dehydrogenase